MSKTVKINLEGKDYEFPLVVGSENEKAIDITHLRRDSGFITLDSSFGNTGSCISEITYIDGASGILRYRGIPIEQLAKQSTFLETSYLLINGQLPNQDQLSTFEYDIKMHTMIHEDIKRFYDGFPKSAHPMAILASVVCSLSTFYQNESGDRNEISYNNRIRLLAKLPTIAAFAYKKSIGQPFMYPDNSKGYCENFLKMMFGVPTMDYEVDPEVVKTLEMLFIIHADHEQNCSTSAVRLVRSAESNLYASIASGICALWGARHGGANQKVVEMLTNMIDKGITVKQLLEDVKNKKEGVRLMGFGHRVYKNFDPRAVIIKNQCDKMLNKLNIKDPLLDLARELEEAALKDEYFIERKLYPNVDFYSGILYKAMGFPVTAFTVLFALGRLPGWIAQAREYGMDPKNKIGRPRQVYNGRTLTEYQDISKR